MGNTGIDHVWTSKECVWCACGPSERLDAPSICLFVFWYVGTHLGVSLRSGSQVFVLLMLFLCVILHTMFSGKRLQLLCILPFVCLSAIRKLMLAVCILVGICVFRELCPVSFLVIGESPSVLL